MKPAITNQLRELSHVRASQQLRIPLDISGVLFEAIRGWVSHQALRKVQEQQRLIPALKAPCSQRFTSSHGLPCAHTLKKLEEERKTLLLEQFHPHWYLKRHVDQPRPMLEPRAASSQHNERRDQPAKSTRREPSAFEAVEAAVQPRAQPTCSRCHSLGHKMTWKACPQRYEELLQSSVASSSSAAAPEQALEAPIVPPSGSPEHAGSGGDGPGCIVVNVGGMSSRAPAVSLAAPSTQAGAGPSLRYDDPRAIYQRYVVARDTWYKAQLSGSVKTNQEYRKAMGLPLRYDKASYQWCLDWKQMGARCTLSPGSRDWTKEEMMAYLDWSKAEDDRVEAQVAAEMESNPFSVGRRGMREIWEAAAKDDREQQSLYSTK